ncbi:MAG: glycosyltransferase family 1 protein [Verrucomicrobiota bacterium]
MTNVSWIPAHPVYGSVSMLRYWKLLEAAMRADDGFSCSSILTASADDLGHHSGKVGKLLTRQVIYPAMVRMRTKGGIAHVLDHSWADLLPFVPKQALKVVTLHDLIPLRFPGELTGAQAGRFRKWVGHLKEADAIIAVSEYTKREVEELLEIDPRKIHVVFNGVEMPDESKISTLPRDGRQFRIGSIGSTLERKNLAILPEALARLRASIQRKIVLVRVGAALPAALAGALRKELGEDGLVELGRLPDEAIGDYYAGLDAVVIPSLYEGFGLPVIEGMAARVPVVASRCTSLPEVGGEVAFYFDPHSPEELAAVLAKVANEGIPSRQIEAGYERAKNLSWRKCLEGIYEVYDGVLG